ncbi:unnamed protein product [Psylliodes chrysocephalus]|uniref:SWIM-type domain-containing protein n=1 Tax=Psylliodes chrysocephalus TaxID=3402493 RepID=A0A9P0CUJ9_9CUCU|nr:unnamed protein product [Psylliodes chrysocephala]
MLTAVQRRLIASNEDKSLMYTVDVNLAMCDCPYGAGGKFCKHLCAVQETCGIVFKNAPLLTASDKKTLAKVSLGYDVPEDFFENMEVQYMECGTSCDNTNNKKSCSEISSIATTPSEDDEIMDRKHLAAIEKLNLSFQRLT